MAENQDNISDGSPEFAAEEIQGKYVPHLVGNVNNTILEDSHDESMNSSVLEKSKLSRST